MLLSPRLLPVDYLVSAWLPLLVAPKETRACLVLPARLWTDQVIAAWLAQKQSTPQQSASS